MQNRGLACIILILLILSTLITGGVYGKAEFEGSNTDNWEYIEEAYVYCFPLVMVDATMKKMTNIEEPTNLRAPVNQLIYGNVLLTADNKAVVSPNVDTIYSSAFLDLNGTALVFVKPETDRFCSVQVMDAFTNTVEVIGSGSKTDNPQDEVICLITGRDFQGDVPDGMTHISVPTDMAWIIIRTVINGPDDLQNVEEIQNLMLLVPLDVYLNDETYVPEKGTYYEGYNYNPVDYVFNMSPEEFFNTANSLMVTNPPSLSDAPLIEEMQAVHVGPGLTFDESVLGSDGAFRWNTMLENLMVNLASQTTGYSSSLGNWNYYGNPIGEWGTAYAYRALIAIKGLGANPTYVAIYPDAVSDSEGQQLSGSARYRMHIEKDMLPPVIGDGFWSFTAYGSDNFLIPNEFDRYSINDRSDVTFNEDGSLDILLQAESPEEGLMNNWLPVGTRDFRINLRIYGPDLEKIQGSWTPPKILREPDYDEGTSQISSETWDIVKEAYIFSYPLVLMDATMKEHTNTVEPTADRAPVNQFKHDDQLKDADFRNVVSPNVDTLYSQAYLDLNSTVFVFIKPEADRFCSVQVMDAYSNTVDVVGSGGGSDNPDEQEICLITGRNYLGDVPEGMTHISVPTDIAWIVVRIVSNGPDDLAAIQTIQNQLLLVPLQDYLQNGIYTPPKGTYSEEFDYRPSDHVAEMSPGEFFSTANLLMVTNPPAPEDAPLMERIQVINVGPGLSFDETILGADASAEWTRMLDSMNPVLSRYYLTFTEKMGDWAYYPYPIGEWGTDYPYRAIIAQVAFGANPTSVAIYPESAYDTGNEKVSGQNRYILKFDEGMLPPVLPGGFWSVTAYGTDSFLIPNSINRYCINDRSNVTYNEDGSLDILLQNEEPKELQSNWLPVGTDDFHLIMRIYLPDMDRILNTWTVPKIERQ